MILINFSHRPVLYLDVFRETFIAAAPYKLGCIPAVDVFSSLFSLEPLSDE